MSMELLGARDLSLFYQKPTPTARIANCSKGSS